MVELAGLRMALDEWQAAETDDDRARAAARVIALAPPRVLLTIMARVDELEALKSAYESRLSELDS
jgi:hypothetical protein